MSAEIKRLRRVETRGAGGNPGVSHGPAHAEILALEADGRLRVRLDDGRNVSCDCLEVIDARSAPLDAGDHVLVLPPTGRRSGVVLGRVSRYRRPEAEKPPATLALQAAESLSLRCGEASVELRADGKVLIRGDDVLVRAKGTQRIRAGTVSIN